MRGFVKRVRHIKRSNVCINTTSTTMAPKGRGTWIWLSLALVAAVLAFAWPSIEQQLRVSGVPCPWPFSLFHASHGNSNHAPTDSAQLTKYTLEELKKYESCSHCARAFMELTRASRALQIRRQRRESPDSARDWRQGAFSLRVHRIHTFYAELTRVTWYETTGRGCDNWRQVLRSRQDVRAVCWHGTLSLSLALACLRPNS